ncbi:MAG: DEAD/DEAH box helicase, partial [Candidatus Heimdallarchaeota archaeon]|nr:DEAD/DEAH box helicase [Candidatus Heimdallarchaeota archaeon]
MNIADLPIPQIVKDKLAEEGIVSLYPPQSDAINKKLLEGNNLVVAIPTASGKTLLAILACLKVITDKGLKTLYLSPLRALAYEKFVEFKNYLDLLGKRTILLTGDYDGEDSSAKYADVIIATNEKIDSAIRHQAK